jgi:hypothetical protein
MRRVELTPLIAAAAAGLAAWISVGSLAVSTIDTSSRFGFLPPVWMAPAMIVAFVIAAWWLRLTKMTALPLFFSVVLLLPWIPGRVPAVFLLWTGPVVYFVWLTIVGAMVVQKGSGAIFARAFGKLHPTPFAPAAIALVAYLAAGWWLFAILPGGDEPHYLIITQSLLRDGDIRVENNYTETQYREYFPASLRPHFGRAGINGERYSIHAPGLPVLVAPAFALFGYPGVLIWLSLIAAAGTALLWRASFVLTGSAGAAWFGWAAGALSAPFFFQAFSVYPDGLGATLVLLAALPLVEERISKVRWIAVGAALALMPWLHTRFAIISAILGVILFLRLIGSSDGRGRLLAFLSVPVASAIGWFAFFRIVYGVFDPSVPYGGDTQTSAANMLTGVPALLFDHQFGILPNAPVYGFCLAGVFMMARRRPRLAIELTTLAISYLLAVSAFYMWWAGSSAPGRFLAPILPVMAIPAAWLWASTAHLSTRAVGGAALLASLFTTGILSGVQRGALAFNVHDGYGRAAEWINPVVDVALGLPSFFRQTSGDAVLRAAIWMSFLLAAALVLRALEKGARTQRAFAIFTPSILAIAIMCALAVVWRLDGVAAANPEKSQMSLLAKYDSVWRPHGVTLENAALASADVALAKINITTPERRGSPPAGTLLLAPDVVPGGEYELRPAGDVPSSGSARLIIGRLARPSRTWNLASDFRDGADTLQLAATVGSLVITGDTGIAASRLTLHPTRIWEGESRLTDQIARRVERYGTALVFFFDLGAFFFEDTGFWIRGGRTTEIAAAPGNHDRPLQIFVRNGAAPNPVRIDIEGVEQEFELHPREERTLPIPIADHRPGALVRIHTQNGFRPSDVEAGSRDTRFLGVWIEFR